MVAGQTGVALAFSLEVNELVVAGAFWQID